MSAESLDQRRILRGVQCVCGQWWPDYVMRAGAALMECCGSSYQVTPLSDGGVMLSLTHDNSEPQTANEDQA